MARSAARLPFDFTHVKCMDEFIEATDHRLLGWPKQNESNLIKGCNLSLIMFAEVMPAGNHSKAKPDSTVSEFLSQP